MNISPLAVVDPGATIGENVQIDPFAVIEKDVVIGDNCHIFPHAVILNGARIGNNCQIFPGAVIAGIPQDLKFRGEITTAEIGNNTTIRECVTVNRGTASKGKTIVGNDCLIMAYSHVAHDCVVRDHVIIGNASQIAGEVDIDDYAIVSGGTLVHQFSRISKHVMIQGGSRFSQDIPPYIIAGKEPTKYCGLNLVGLRRRGFSNELIDHIHNAYRLLYSKGILSEGIQEVKNNLQMTKEISYILDFVENSKRGIIR